MEKEKKRKKRVGRLNTSNRKRERLSSTFHGLYLWAARSHDLRASSGLYLLHGGTERKQCTQSSHSGRHSV
jgi:hypothetical protein